MGAMAAGHGTDLGPTYAATGHAPMPDSVLQATMPPATARLVLLHGWGADADDLMPLGAALSAQLPFSIDCLGLPAPEPHPGGMGRQWYGLFPGDWQAVSPAVEQLQQRLEALEQTPIPLSRTVLIGFSQGGAMAVHAGCNLPLAGVIGCSAYGHPNWKAPQWRPPVLLLHGLNDEVVPPEASANLQAELKEGSSVDCHLMNFPGGHAIPQQAEQAMVWMISSWLS
ncbi:phospholipase/carboxylesterase [Synechococcus sp. A18-25c]|nr:phospholipase/carboxylesterase [Synechococcus sp. A18-25c]